MSDPQRVAVFTIPVPPLVRRRACRGADRALRQGPARPGRRAHPAAQQSRGARGHRGVRPRQRQRPAAAAADPDRRSRARRADRRRARSDRRWRADAAGDRPARAAAARWRRSCRGEGSGGERCGSPPISRGRSTRCWSRRSTRAARARPSARRSDLARHWEKSLEQLRADLSSTGRSCSPSGARSTSPSGATACCAGSPNAGRTSRPPGFTVAAGITTAAPAVAALLRRVARMPERHGRPARPVARRHASPTRNGTRSARTSKGAARRPIRNSI